MSKFSDQTLNLIIQEMRDEGFEEEKIIKLLEVIKNVDTSIFGQKEDIRNTLADIRTQNKKFKKLVEDVVELKEKMADLKNPMVGNEKFYQTMDFINSTAENIEENIPDFDDLKERLINIEKKLMSSFDSNKSEELFDASKINLPGNISKKKSFMTEYEKGGLA